MPKRACIRCDGNSDIGLGHIIRCISLAHMIKEDFSICFFSMTIPDILKKEIENLGWEAELFENESDFLGQLGIDDIVVLDGYHFDSGYQKEVKKKGCKLVCIDDFQAQYFYADLVINHAPMLSKEEYKGEPYTRYLLGSDYTLIRPEFLNRRYNSDKSNDDIKEVKNLFICFGGADFKNLSARVLSWLPSNNYSITVVLGNAYLHHDELDRIIKERGDLEVSVKSSLSSKEMRREFEIADLAIIPASGILFEVISTGLPALSGYYVENQKGIYNGFKKLGAFIDTRKFDKGEFLDGINSITPDLLNRIKENQRKAIDGISNHRIQQEFKKLSLI